MLRQLDTARQALQAQLDTLRSMHIHPDIADNASARLAQLNLLRDQLVGGANGTSPAALRADITAAIASTLAYTSQISTVAGGAQGTSPEQAAQVALQQASAASRQTVSDFERDFYGRHIFDPYLKFTSAEDQEAYRQREAERQQAIEKARAENTPEGNLRANELAIEQLRDAGAHGADRNPDYERTMTSLETTRDHLAAALTPKARKDHETARTAAMEPDAAPTTQIASISPELIAKLRGAGVSVPDQQATGHGVNQYAPSNSGGIVRT